MKILYCAIFSDQAVKIKAFSQSPRL